MESGLSIDILTVLAASASGVAVSLFVATLAAAAAAPRSNASPQLLERQRVEKLRERSLIFRWFEPIIYEWAAFFPSENSTSTLRLQRGIDATPNGVPWRVAEFKSASMLNSLLTGICFGVCAFTIYGVSKAVGVAVLVAAVLFNTTVSSPTAKLATRRRAIIRRLPFAVDLLALIMEAGGTFNESLRTLVRQEKNHPLGLEFGRVLEQLDLGSTQREALENLRSRMPEEDDVGEFVFSVVKGQELGTPLAKILRNQADQMRLKRSQRAEKAAGEAQVKMAGPGIVIMIACMAIIAGPFIMNFWQSFTEGGGGLFK